MRIGILTFHDSLNYGGVLQCWALKEVLVSLGHEVCIIDRRMCRNCKSFETGLSVLSPGFFRAWVGLVYSTVMGCGYLSRVIRTLRTKWFVEKLGLTGYHFYTWSEAPKELGLDCIVVGSDQVWHGGDWGMPEVYLLERAPRVSAIAYAASFGMSKLPDGVDYANGFSRFGAIGVREKEGIELVRSTGYGGPLKHVVDPTLLIPREAWQALGKASHREKKLVCYFLSQDIGEELPKLRAWSERTGWRVDVLCDAYTHTLPRNLAGAILRMREMLIWLKYSKRVRVCASYGPKEFVSAFASADACITDSFHALMFSSIFNINVRALKPNNEKRRVMFARIEEFISSSINGDAIASDVEQALASIENDERMTFDQDVIAARREESLSWFVKNLNEVLAKSDEVKKQESELKL